MWLDICGPKPGHRIETADGSQVEHDRQQRDEDQCNEGGDEALGWPDCRPGQIELTEPRQRCSVRKALREFRGVVEADGRLVIPASGVTIGDELVEALRDADRR